MVGVTVATYVYTLGGALALALVVVVILKWLILRACDHTIALDCGTLALIAKGDKPGWDLGIYGSYIVVFRHAGAIGGLLKPETSRNGAMWLVGEPDKNGWRTGRRISIQRLNTLVQDASSNAPKELA